MVPFPFQCTGAAAIVALSSIVPLASAVSPVSNVQVTLKGKKYQIDDVTTVSELQERLEEQSGIVPSKQGKILHNGKRLGSDDENMSLSEAGVAEGDQLNCVPSKKSSSSKKKSSSTSAASKAAPAPPVAAAAAEAEASSVDSMGGLNDVISKMMSGGMGGAGAGGMPDMAESMKMMKELTQSPLFAEYMNNPEKLEESRQAILSNPMMKGMMSSMPGMSEMLEDKEGFAQMMQAAAGIMQSMEPEDMMKMMEAQGMGGAAGGMPPGMGGMGGGMPDMGGLFDGAASASVSSALDELSEGED